MADEQDLSKRIGLTRGKMALIGVLVVTLVAVLYSQYGPDGMAENADTVDPALAPTSPPRAQAITPAPSAASASASPSVAAVQQSGELSTPFSETLDQARWKSPDVATIVGYDPFALPAGFPRTVQLASEGQGADSGPEDAAKRASQLADTVAKMRTELEALRQRGVRVIVKQRDEYVAMIGDRTIHVGDEINGFTVTAIEPDGVRVERKVPQ